jgi:hypothetical protein
MPGKGGRARLFMYRGPNSLIALAFTWSPARSQRRFQAQFLSHVGRPGHAAIRRPTIHASAHRFEFSRRQRLIDPVEPRVGPRHRSGHKITRPIVRRVPQSGARPVPVLRSPNQFSTQGIPLDIAKQREQMPILFDGKSLEAALPKVSAVLVMFVVAAHVRVQQPVHPLAQVAVVFRPERQVEMVGHQTVPQDPHRNFDTSMGHGFEKRQVVAILAENPPTIVAAIEDVVTKTANRSSWVPCHCSNIPDFCKSVNRKRACPLFVARMPPRKSMARSASPRTRSVWRKRVTTFTKTASH